MAPSRRGLNLVGSPQVTASPVIRRKMRTTQPALKQATPQSTGKMAGTPASPVIGRRRQLVRVENFHPNGKGDEENAACKGKDLQSLGLKSPLRERKNIRTPPRDGEKENQIIKETAVEMIDKTRAFMERNNLKTGTKSKTSKIDSENVNPENWKPGMDKENITAAPTAAPTVAPPRRSAREVKPKGSGARKKKEVAQIPETNEAQPIEKKGRGKKTMQKNKTEKEEEVAVTLPPPELPPPATHRHLLRGEKIEQSSAISKENTKASTRSRATSRKASGGKTQKDVETVQNVLSDSTKQDRTSEQTKDTVNIYTDETVKPKRGQRNAKKKREADVEDTSKLTKSAKRLKSNMGNAKDNKQNEEMDVNIENEPRVDRASVLSNNPVKQMFDIDKEKPAMPEKNIIAKRGRRKIVDEREEKNTGNTLGKRSRAKKVEENKTITPDPAAEAPEVTPGPAAEAPAVPPARKSRARNTGDKTGDGKTVAPQTAQVTKGRARKVAQNKTPPEKSQGFDNANSEVVHAKTDKKKSRAGGSVKSGKGKDAADKDQVAERSHRHSVSKADARGQPLITSFLNTSKDRTKTPGKSPNPKTTISVKPKLPIWNTSSKKKRIKTVKTPSSAESKRRSFRIGADVFEFSFNPEEDAGVKRKVKRPRTKAPRTKPRVTRTKTTIITTDPNWPVNFPTDSQAARQSFKEMRQKNLSSASQTAKRQKDSSDKSQRGSESVRTNDNERGSESVRSNDSEPAREDDYDAFDDIGCVDNEDIFEQFEGETASSFIPPAEKSTEPMVSASVMPTPAISKYVSNYIGASSTPRADNIVSLMTEPDALPPKDVKEDIAVCFGFDDSESELDEMSLNLSPVRATGQESQLQVTNMTDSFASDYQISTLHPRTSGYPSTLHPTRFSWGPLHPGFKSYVANNQTASMVAHGRSKSVFSSTTSSNVSQVRSNKTASNSTSVLSQKAGSGTTQKKGTLAKKGGKKDGKTTVQKTQKNVTTAAKGDKKCSPAARVSERQKTLKNKAITDYIIQEKEDADGSVISDEEELENEERSEAQKVLRNSKGQKNKKNKSITDYIVQEKEDADASVLFDEEELENEEEAEPQPAKRKMSQTHSKQQPAQFGMSGSPEKSFSRPARKSYDRSVLEETRKKFLLEHRGGGDSTVTETEGDEDVIPEKPKRQKKVKRVSKKAKEKVAASSNDSTLSDSNTTMDPKKKPKKKSKKEEEYEESMAEWASQFNNHFSEIEDCELVVS